MERSSLRILIADDHPLVGDLLEVYIRRALPEAEVVSVASLPAARTALSEAADCTLALLDLNMPGMGGAEQVAELRRDFPETRFAIISGTGDHRAVRACLGAGAIGFLPKTLTGQAMVDAIRLMAGGGSYLPIEMLTQPAEPEPTAGGPALTPREREVLDLILEGTPNKLIAYRLEISEPTVKLHLRGLFRKFSAANRTQLVAEAMAAGFVPSRTTYPKG
ncbi:LuxR C-terminal-related transcriptional regulator [Tistlia consotensis]|uniref:LuxR C-terminal-related transcriptional regulator n=1 Tax=Tistlia consotensis TaxID=1321365 RepID=UPI001356601D|nr:response regulator transcription factor [Tistlia consotensis]